MRTLNNFTQWSLSVSCLIVLMTGCEELSQVRRGASDVGDIIRTGKDILGTPDEEKKESDQKEGEKNRTGGETENGKTIEGEGVGTGKERIKEAGFDFKPGNQVLASSHFTSEPLGARPKDWLVLKGNFDIVEFQGERWIRTVTSGFLRPRLKLELPERYTIEFDVVVEDVVTASNEVSVHFGLSRGPIFTLSPDGSSFTGTDPIKREIGEGRHHVDILVEGDQIRIWVDQRLRYNIETMSPRDGLRFELEIGSEEDTLLLSNIRIASILPG